MIASLALPALFIASGIFALSVLAMTWRAYAGEIRSIRQELKSLESNREFLVRIALTEMREPTPSVRRGMVRRSPAVAFGASGRALPQPAQRAAA